MENYPFYPFLSGALDEALMMMLRYFLHIHVGSFSLLV